MSLQEFLRWNTTDQDGLLQIHTWVSLGSCAGALESTDMTWTGLAQELTLGPQLFVDLNYENP